MDVAIVAAYLVAMIAFGLALRQRLGSGVVPDEGSVIEALTDQPLET